MLEASTDTATKNKVDYLTSYPPTPGQEIAGLSIINLLINMQCLINKTKNRQNDVSEKYSYLLTLQNFQLNVILGLKPSSSAEPTRRFNI
jgi:hypothetical protein